MATLPSFVFDSYKRYKEDTNRVATWLVETAQKYGHPLKGQPPTSRPSGRLKGKERKKTREAEKSRHGGTTIPPIRCTITVKEFTDLANWIANVKPRVKVPQVIVGLIRSAITLRKRCADWFQGNIANEEVTADNSKHTHFIGVLERVLNILEPNSSSGSTDSAQPTHTQSSARTQTELDTLTNIYDVLSIDDYDDCATMPETAAVAENVASRQTTPQPPRRKSYEMETTDDEILLAYFCFFSDLNELRKAIQTLWLRYKDRSLDLMTVSVTTNIAINLVRLAEQDLPSPDSIRSPLDESVQKFIGMISGNNPHNDDKPDDVVKRSRSDLAEWLFEPIQTALRDFCDGIQRDGLTITACGFWDPSLDRTLLTASDKDRLLLFESLIEFFPWTQMDGKPVQDELTQGLAGIFSGKPDMFWVGYAAQIFVDIHNTLGDDVGRGLSELQAAGTRIASVLEEFLKSSKSVETPVAEVQAISGMHGIINHWIVGDALDRFKRQYIKPSVSLPPDPFSLFKRHPQIGGLFQFQLYMGLQVLSTAIATDRGSILSVAHLYECCRQAGYLKAIWPDMELVMDVHKREQIFLGRVPQTPAESLKCILLILGVSPVYFARTQRLNNIKWSKRERGLNSVSPVMNVFRKQLMEMGDSTLTINDLDNLLSARNFESNSNVATARKGDPSLLQRQWAKSHKITSLQLIDTLSHAIAAEERTIRFDYLSLHLRCLRILRDLRTVYDDIFRHRFGRNYVENETQMPLVVVYIFHLAKVADGSVLKLASDVVQEFIEREGSVEINRLDETCVCRPREGSPHSESEG